MVCRVDMFPHLLHTKQFLDWRFGRQDDEDSQSTPAASGAWSTTRRRARRLRVIRSRRRLTTCRLKSARCRSVRRLSDSQSPTTDHN